jgi:hypothetical protein
LSNEESNTKKKLRKPRGLYHRIVNYFLFFAIGLFILFLLALGFSQTSTFREFARKEVLGILNDSLNGRFNIGQIDGTIFTTLIVRDVSLESQNQTIFKIDKIALRIKPLRILNKDIYVQELNIDGVSGNLVKDSAGVYNIEKVFPPTSKDTSETNFPFAIKVSSLHVNGLNCNITSWDKQKDLSLQPNFNLDNLRITNLDMQVGAEVKLNDKSFNIHLKNLNFDSNIKDFNVKELSGRFLVDKKQVSVKDFVLQTTLSKINLGLQVQGINIFKFSGKTFETAPINIRLESNDFNFDDLTTFIPGTKILKGNITTLLEGSGTIKEFDIKTLRLQYGKTILQTTGKLKDLNKASQLLIHARFKDSYINEDDVAHLLPTIDLPRFKGFESLAIDSLLYDGTPFKFVSKFKIQASSGVIRSTTSLDYSGDKFIYDIVLNAGNLDLEELAHHPITFNGDIRAKGVGVNPKTASINYSVDGRYTVIGRQIYNTLKLEGEVKDSELRTTLAAKTGVDSLLLSADVNFANDSLPVYKAYLTTNHFDIRPVLLDSTLSSDINGELRISGRGFQPDKMSGNVNLHIFNSVIADKIYDDFSANVDLQSSTNLQKKLTFNSDIIEGTVSGNFSFLNIGDIITQQFAGMSKTISQKLESYFPKKSASPIISNTPKSIAKADSLARGNYNINITMQIKNLEKISMFIPNKEISGEGNFQCSLVKNKTDFSCSFNATIPFIKYYDKYNAFFLRNAQFDCTLKKPVGDNSITALNGDLHTSIERLFVKSDLKKIDCDIIVKDGQIGFTGSAGINDNMSSALDLSLDLRKDSLLCNVSKVKLKYNNYEVNSKEKFLLKYFADNLYIHNFNLWRGDGRVTADGVFSMENAMNMKLDIVNLKGYDVSYSLLGMSPANIVDNDFNMEITATGTLKNPKYTFHSNLDSITYKKVNFGSLIGDLVYENGRMNTNINFIEKVGNVTKPRLNIAGYVPVNLSLGAQELIPQDGQIDLHILSDDFNLASFGDAIPYTSRIRGTMNAKLDFTGTIKDMERNGYLRITNTAFHLLPNNLDYAGGMLIRLNNKTVLLDSFVVKNIGKVKNKGAITGGGAMFFADEGMNMTVNLSGELTVLSEDAKTSASSIYGDCFVATDGNITFTINKDRSFLSVPLLVKEAKLIYPLSQTAYSGSADNFVYHYAGDEGQFSTREKEIQRLIELASQKKVTPGSGKVGAFNFDYEVKVKIKDEANFIFDFAQGANQKLNAVLKGDLLFERKNGIQNFQGELKVLDGSTLEFLKTFSATGTLRFESDVTNPYLDITGVYNGYYSSSDTTSSTTSKEEPVAVKVKLKGPVKDLAKNFAQDENNITLYIGTSNIESETASTEYDKADAMWFVLTGKFKKDLTQAEKSKAAGQIDLFTGTATSLAGSLIGGMLNAYLGDYVKSLEIKNVGTMTKFNLSGKYRSFRYTIGGSTNFLQDLSSANIRIEYPIIESFVIRLERKESVTETSTNNEMINELGLSYKFEF